MLRHASSETPEAGRQHLLKSAAHGQRNRRRGKSYPPSSTSTSSQTPTIDEYRFDRQVKTVMLSLEQFSTLKLTFSMMFHTWYEPLLEL